MIDIYQGVCAEYERDPDPDAAKKVGQVEKGRRNT
jgi:hypothetical protein